ncbi:MAG TPA: CCA tRNA nucleotidyltransferase [Stellaceae bacterium]|nr:CCA tRNA nucleotidyltransferase [Stellaceae bacterium]
MKQPRQARRLPPQPWISEAPTQRVLAALAAGEAEARFVGGSVRDALLGREIGDIDIATPAPPERVIELLGTAGIKVVPTGLAHGTVTAVAAPRHFEITTLRRDVETYGRHARVAFDADWAADASRRDFTMNAVYLAPDGTLFDPVGGIADLRAGRVRFVGDPARRIAEDVLRLLRYYRFEASFGKTRSGDPAARAACRAARDRLPTLSAERVRQELMKLFDATDPLPALAMMREDGVLAAVLPEARRFDRLKNLVAIEPARDPLRRLAAAIETGSEGALALAGRLRFPNAWRDRLAGLVPPWPLDPAADERAQRRALHRVGAARYRDITLILAAGGALAPARLRELSALADNWTAPRFPLKGRDVTALGVLPGERVGRLLEAVRQSWEEGDFAASRAECLARLKALVGEAAQ